MNSSAVALANQLNIDWYHQVTSYTVAAKII
ncbi:unnamed protein product, partial [Rotaria sp. Silwood1]